MATYRLQLTPDFGFREAIGVLGHLRRLGVTHVYASPLTEAVPGSSHGYDVVDHTSVRSDFGGSGALDELLDALEAHELELVVDHVANHASVARPELNAPWWQMLRDGESSPGARWFDVDRTGADRRVVLPILGDPLAKMIADDRIRVDEAVGGGRELSVDGAVRLPLAAGTEQLPLDALLDRQHYRLAHWREHDRNVRRFFTIDDLVAVRVEEPDVAAAVDDLPVRLMEHPAVAGVRIDHLDGLADPAGYLAALRSRLGDDAWILVEKILAPGETLPEPWNLAGLVDGTTGYEFARITDHLLLDRASEPLLRRRWAELTGDARSFDAVEIEARREVLDRGLRPDLERTAAAAGRALGTGRDSVEEDRRASPDAVVSAIAELTVHLPRYRTYLPDDPDGQRVLAEAAAAAAAAAPHLGPVIERLTTMLLEPGSDDDREFRTRWQQLTGPAMAKGAEDRAFYRHLPLASLCEVGGAPDSFGATADEFHAHNTDVQRRWPTTLLAGSTHDTKRADDVRARSAALTAFASEWVDRLDDWLEQLDRLVPGVPPPTAWLALQTVTTCPGLDAERLGAFLVKAEREADVRTSWTEPDEAFERMLGALGGVLAPAGTPSELARSVSEWALRLDDPGRRVSLVATALRMTAPGVPDLYQGTEIPSFRLVDPDNRIPPDWNALADAVDRASALDLPSALVEAPDIAKLVVVQRCLALRRRLSAAFGRGAGYEPIDVGAAPLVGFARTRAGQPAVIVVAAIQPAVVESSGLVDPVPLPAGRWRDVLTGPSGDALSNTAPPTDTTSTAARTWPHEVFDGAFTLDLSRAPVAVLELVRA